MKHAFVLCWIARLKNSTVVDEEAEASNVVDCEAKNSTVVDEEAESSNVVDCEAKNSIVVDVEAETSPMLVR